MKWEALYYAIGLVVGVLFSLFVLGTSVSVTYFLNGRQVEVEMADPLFLSYHLNELKTLTVVDYDGLITNFTRSTSEIFPPVTINGGINMEAYVSLTVILANTALILLLFWVSRHIYRSKQK